MTLELQNSPKSRDLTPLDCDLTIVGGGIVGATLANALKNSGLKITIIEAQPPEKSATKPQAYALSLLSGRIFQGIGVWDKMLPQMGKFSHIALSDADYSGIVKFQTSDLGTDYLGYVGQHNSILKTLQEAITGYSNIRSLCPAKVVQVDYEATQAIITLEIARQVRQVRTKLVIGADGARSPIRTLGGIKTQGWKYWQSCITFTIKHNCPRNDIAFERFWYSGPMGILPLQRNLCQVVWTAPHTQAKAIQELPESDFLAQLKERTQGSLGEIELVSERYLFPVQLMQSECYIKPRLALVGDAAHCCHPVGGQGLNLGIRDAAALAQVLQEANQKGEDIGDLKVLKRYESWRRQENWLILGFTDFLNRLFSNNWLPLVAIRRLGLELMGLVPPFKNLALRLMTGLLGKIPQLAKN
ncbi:FAD-dependent hydroxylase [Aphanothece sacrum]|uniref:Ubiquinone biosynthesis hydroxylase UbiH n=1 Tax=Aphanothece sacrum FPU1 TaxID=1920663 RepID=A0A401IMQ1_APHSA|nr:FAD-dependent hydroxylase [Aphanothece sacrum]GBF82544.1 ubiquinone biosynthesis hydroxylase UbiH [Aphanothece sacrum FPU1]GBF84678.1 ubiquinone biosynthesis hydroxylase [Aphanothece sacrum FPU3]